MSQQTPVNSTVPVAVSVMDGATGNLWTLPLVSQDAGANATVISTNGTTTVNTGGGQYYGCNAIGLGTLWTVAVFDVVGTSSKTLSASISIGALGALALAGPTGVPVKYLGNLLVVTAGTTAGTLNALWD